MRLLKAGVAGALAAFAIGGCGIDKVAESARQLDLIGEVEVSSVFCTSGDMSADSHSCAGYERAHRGQALVAYRIPDGSVAPQSLADDGGNWHFTPSDSYAAYMQEHYPEAGMHWTAYASDVKAAAPGDSAAFTVSPSFPLPQPGAPFDGPFRYSVTGGWRELTDDADDGSSPVDCGAPRDISCTPPGEDSAFATRDLGVRPSPEVPEVVQGGHVDVPFEVRLAGAGGSSFGFTATSELDGASVSVDGQVIESGANTVPVHVAVPADAQVGTYAVTLLASASGDPDVIIHRQTLTSAIHNGGTVLRSGTMTFRVVAPPPEVEEPTQTPAPAPAPAPPPTPVPATSEPPLGAVPPAMPPAAPAAPAAARARLRLSLTPLPRKAHSGDYVSYLLVAQNAAREPARRTRVCQTLPAHMQFVRASRRLRFRGRDLCFHRSRLTPGDALATLVYVHVDTDAPAGLARARAVARASNSDRAEARARLRVLRRAAVPQRAPVTG